MKIGNALLDGRTYTRRLLFQLFVFSLFSSLTILTFPVSPFIFLSCLVIGVTILLNHVQELNREKAKAAAALKSLQEKLEEKHKVELQEKVRVYFSRWNVIIYYG